MSEKFYPSDWVRYPELMAGRLVFPFFPTHSEARRTLVQQVKAGQVWLLSGGQLLLAIAGDKHVRITNLIQNPSNQLTWRKILTTVETFLRQQFVKSVSFPLAVGALAKDWLLEQGYQVTDEGFYKSFHYRTALVLGGGGAKGAYQIGVWQALKAESISYDWITGTSVGALNGALILMDDVAIACNLWLTISTDKVLAFPEASATSATFTTLLQQVASLAITAVKDNGVSTKPLQDLLRATFDEEKMLKSKKKLFLCTTRFPALQEVVHEFNIEKGLDELDWLVASASFYPGMNPMEIAGEWYVDGGYRNNVPIDVAVAQGARECICVDVKGPGLTKKVTLDAGIARIDLRSPWSLGNLLVFDRERSETNYRLGYLETMKYFGHFHGYWYTFTKETIWRKEWQVFLRSLKNTPLQAVLKQPDFWKKVGKLYQHKALIEEGGLVFVELLARLFEVPPTHVYTKKQFLAALRNAQENQPTPIGSLSIGEWMQQYQQRLPLSDKNQFGWFYQKLQKGTLSSQMMMFEPILSVAAKFLHFLFQ